MLKYKPSMLLALAVAAGFAMKPLFEIGPAMDSLVAAGPMIRTLVSLSSVDLGLRPERVLGLSVPLIGDHTKTGSSWSFGESRSDGLHLARGRVGQCFVGAPDRGLGGQPFTTGEDPNPAAGQTPSADYVIAGPDISAYLAFLCGRGKFSLNPTHRLQSKLPS